MYIAVVEDDKQIQQFLRDQILEYASIHGQELSVRVYPSGESFLKDFRANLYVAIFLDIYMSGMTGIDAAMEVRKTDNQVSVVFLTSSPEHMQAAFRCHAYEYLLKPPDRDRLFATLDGILRLKTEVCERLPIRAEGRDLMLPFPEIVSVVAQGHYTRIRVQDGTEYLPLMPFRAAQEALAHDPRFLVLLRGVLVNLDYVVGFQDGVCRLTDRTTLPINLRTQTLLNKQWETYKFNKVRAR